MDPFTASQIAGMGLRVCETACTAGRTLSDFVRDVKRVGETMQEFASEVQALEVACFLVNTHVTKLMGGKANEAQAGEEEQLLFACLKRQVEDCERVGQQLKAAIPSIDGKDLKSTSVSKRIKWQIKNNMNAKDIEAARNRISRHTSSLLLNLQSLTINLVYVIPGRVDERLRAILDEGGRQREKLQILRAQPDSGEGSSRRNEDTILKVSKEVLSSGETLYTESVFGGSTRGDARTGNSAYIYEWINDAKAIEDVASPMSSVDTDAPSVFSTSQRKGSLANTEDTQLVTQGGESSSVVPTPYDEQDTDGSPELEPDEQFDIEAAQGGMEDGRAAFERADYVEASELLQEAFKIVRALPPSRQTICDTCAIRYMLGVCAFNLDNPPTLATKQALLSIIDRTPEAKVQDDTRRLEVVNAGHLLAQVYIQLGELDRALSICNSSLLGKRQLKVPVKMSESYLESVALMAKILELQGNSARAKIIANMLPSDQKSELLGKFVHLKPRNAEALDASSIERAAHLQILPMWKENVKATEEVEGNTEVAEPEVVDGNARAGNYEDTARQTIDFSNREKRPELPARTNNMDVLPPSRKSRTISRASTEPGLKQPESTLPVTSSQADVKVTDSRRGSRSSLSSKLRARLIHHKPAGQDQLLTQLANTDLNKPSAPKPVEIPEHAHSMQVTRSEQNHRYQALRVLAMTAGSRVPQAADVATRQSWLKFLPGSGFYQLTDTSELSKRRQTLLTALKTDANQVEAAREYVKKRGSKGLFSETFWILEPLQTSSSKVLHAWEIPLHLASLYGDVEVVKLLVGSNAKVNSLCIHGLTALHCAAMGGFYDIVKILTNAGCNVDVSSELHGSPLCLAVLGERFDIVELLLRKAASLNTQHGPLGTVAHLACMTGNLALVQALCNDLHLLSATARCRLAWIRRYRNVMTYYTKRQPEAEGLAPFIDDTGTVSRRRFKTLEDVTPLAIAAYMGCNEVVAYLISKDVDTQHHCRASFEHGEASKSAPPHRTYSILELACTAGHVDVVKALFDSGRGRYRIPKDRSDGRVRTDYELWAAAVNDRCECVLPLLNHGFSISLEIILFVLTEGMLAVMNSFAEYGIPVDIAAAALKHELTAGTTYEMLEGRRKCFEILALRVD